MQQLEYDRGLGKRKAEFNASLPVDKEMIGEVLEYFLNTPNGKEYYGGWLNNYTIDTKNNLVRVGKNGNIATLRYMRYELNDNFNQPTDTCYIFIQVYGNNSDMASGHHWLDEVRWVLDKKSNKNMLGHIFALETPFIPEEYNDILYYDEKSNNYVFHSSGYTAN